MSKFIAAYPNTLKEFDTAEEAVAWAEKIMDGRKGKPGWMQVFEVRPVEGVKYVPKRA